MHTPYVAAAPAVAVTLSAAVASPGPARAAPSSVYTEHRYASCPKGPSPEPGIIEVRVCSGPAGIPVKLIGEADAATLRIGRAPLEEELGVGSFYEPSEKIEWMGANEGGGAPIAAIVRYKVGKSVGALKESRLVVYRLEPTGRSCVMAIVREPDANAKARAAVASSAAGFRCGSSKRAGG